MMRRDKKKDSVCRALALWSITSKDVAGYFVLMGHGVLLVVSLLLATLMRA